MLKHPAISVIITSYNSAAHLPRCIESLAAQTFQDFEVILVDNGSGDSSVLSEQMSLFPFHLHIEQLPNNLGFAPANNLGVRLAKGKWVVLLNADAYPEPEWLQNYVRVAEKSPEYSGFSSRQIQYTAPHLLDGAGDVYHISGLAWRNGYNLQSHNYGLEQKDIFSPCGAAALYLRDEFLRLGGFDESYFSYFEDVDLGFRIRLEGGKCLYVPEAVVYHVGSASTGKRSDFSVYYGYRNLIWTFVKNMPSPLIWLLLPLHILVLSFFIFYLTLRGQGKMIWKAVFDALRGLPIVLKKRKTIQKNKTISSRELLKAMSTSLLEPYREFSKRNLNT